MSVTEQQRRFLLDRLSEALGPEAASLMAGLLPFHSSGELVTRTDLAATTTMLRGEMAELRGEFSELRGEFSKLRGEFIGFRGEMKGAFYRWGAVIVGANTIAVVTALIT